MKYAKFISETEISYPDASDFPSIINPLANDSLMRNNGFYPLIGEPENREGFDAVPARFEFVCGSKVVERSRQVLIADYDENGDEAGKHTEWEKYNETVDDSFVRILEWRYDPIPEPEEDQKPDTAARDEAELAIVRLIAGLARRYDAVQDILSMPETGIPELQALAVRKGVPQEEFNALVSEITPMKWQLEAVTGGTWAECWAGLKSRIQAHVAALMREMAQ